MHHFSFVDDRIRPVGWKSPGDSKGKTWIRW
jgi:hypothetical protein